MNDSETSKVTVHVTVFEAHVCIGKNITNGTLVNYKSYNNLFQRHSTSKTFVPIFINFAVPAANDNKLIKLVHYKYLLSLYKFFCKFLYKY